MLRHVFVLASLWLFLAGKAAHACPRCFSEAGPEQREAYLGTTVLLSVLPLLLLGLLAWRLYRGSRRDTDEPRNSREEDRYA